MVLKQAVRTPLELFWLELPGLTLQWLLDLLENSLFGIEACQDIVCDNMGNIDKLFEKGPANTHREDCILAEILFNEFHTWMKKYSENDNLIEVIPKLLSQLGNFIERRLTNHDISLPQESVFYSLYATVVALAIWKVLVEKVTVDETNNKESFAIFTKSLEWVKELQKLDNEQCFYHFKLEMATKFLLGETIPRVEIVSGT